MAIDNKLIIVVGFLVMIVLISGCSAEKQVQTAPSGDSSVKVDVDISGFAFNPATLTVPKGTAVVWVNSDSVKHTIVSDAGTEINSAALSKGQTYSHTFNTAGTYNYYCSLHPAMIGKIIIN